MKNNSGVVRKRKRYRIWYGFAAVFLLFFCFCGVNLYRELRTAKMEADNLLELAVSAASAEAETEPIAQANDGMNDRETDKSQGGERKMLPRYRKLAERNPDLFGWLTIPDTVIDYPVMYAPDREQYYLNRDFDGNYSGSGLLFIDERCPADGSFYLIYGHHMQNGSMFGQLPKYQKQDFWEEHPVFRFDTLYEQREYAVMAVILTQVYDENITGVFRYDEYYDLSDSARFEEYVRQVKNEAIYDTGVDAVYGEELLALSTCNYHTDEGRLVVVAKRIRLSGDAEPEYSAPRG